MDQEQTDTLKVIVIDDEECIRDTFRWHLEDLGHEALTFSEPLSCHVYQGHDCTQGQACGDALLIDYNMPRMNGLQFIARLVEHGCRGMASNMVIMSGNTSEIDLGQVKRLGCRVEQKPLSLDFLEDWLEDVISRRKDSAEPG